MRQRVAQQLLHVGGGGWVPLPEAVKLSGDDEHVVDADGQDEEGHHLKVWSGVGE